MVKNPDGTQGYKRCALCGSDFYRAKYESDNQWDNRRYCSKSCAGTATKGRKLSDEVRNNIRVGHLGKKFSVDHCRKISLALTGIKRTPETKAILSAIASQRKLSDEHKAKIGDSIRGNKHPNWKGGITPIMRALRKGREYRQWRNDVLARDGSRCRKCHRGDVRLDAHHIFSFTLFPAQRFQVNNGLTLCVRCHTKYKDQLYQLVLV